VKVIKWIGNALGILMAAILSLILMAMLILAPVVSAGGSLLQAENLQQVVNDIDFTEVIKGSIEEGSVEGELLNELMETKLMEELLALYVEDFFAVLDGENVQKKLTADTLKNLMNDHMEELLPIMKSYIGVDIPLPEETLSNLVSQMLEAEAEEIIEMLPSPEDLGLDESVVMTVRALREGILLKALIIVIAVLSLLIVLCRFVRFKGFMWLGVGYCLPAAMVLAAALFIRNYGAALINELVPEAEVILECVLSVLTSQMLKGTGVIAGAGVIFILIFALGRRIHKKENTIVKAA